jgi:hypothetical protein
MTAAKSLIAAVSHPAVPPESGRESDMRAQSSFGDGTRCHYAAGFSVSRLAINSSFYYLTFQLG